MKRLVIPEGTIVIANLTHENQYSICNTYFVDISECEDVEEIYMPDSVIIIGSYAFSGFVNLKTIRLSNNLRYVDVNAFRYCISLNEIYVPSSVLKFESPFITNVGGNIYFGGTYTDYQIAQGENGNRPDGVMVHYNTKPDVIRSHGTYLPYPKGESIDLYQEIYNKTKGPTVYNEHLIQEEKNALYIVKEKLTFNHSLKLIDSLIDNLDEKEREEKKIAEVTEKLTNYEDLSWENVYEDSEETKGVYADSASEGLVLSLRNKGKVDIEYIAEITGLEMKDVINKLKGTIYQDPNSFEEKYYKGWKTSDEYLSGNLRKKLKEAKLANDKYTGVFADNIKALTEIMPEEVLADDIYFNLSSSWIPENIIKDYLCSLLNITSDNQYENCINHKEDGSWLVRASSTTYTAYNVIDSFSTKQVRLNKMIEKVLNLSDISVYDKVSVPGKKNKQSILNQGNTLLAIEKANALNQNFIEYCKSRPNIYKNIQDVYNDKYATYVSRKFNGNFLEFNNLNKNVSLYDYQKNAVARIVLSSNNVLLAHDVGTGKTFIIAAAIMEMRRMKTSIKNMIVVPNNIISQWKEIFKNLYSDAKLKVVEPKDFTKEKKEVTLIDIRDNDYDAIIIGKSSFNLIKTNVDKEIAEIESAIVMMLANNVSPESKHIKSLNDKLTKLYEYKNTNEILFEDLNINTLFVDEAHTYKNITIVTPSGSYALNKEGSDECNSMLKKVRIVKAKDPNNKIVFATGTPITNSISDCYAMQMFLQEGELKLLDINSFGDWMSMYAEKKDELEIDVDTTNYRVKTRFSRFHNLPQLTAIFANVADFYQLEEMVDLPKFNGYTDIVIPKTDEFQEFLNGISIRVDNARHHITRVEDDNLLKITTDGRKAALDLRLVDYDKYKNYKCGKIYSCAKCVSDIYYKTMDKLSTQLIFIDSSISQNKFNLYDELKDILVNTYFIPEDKIKFISDATSDRERAKLFNKVRNGEIRILIGSTQKLGTGVNVQDKLIAIHHVDVPWRPADMVQREGRILRQGNSNDEIFIYRYVQEGSFDAYSWQILETKEKFINNILSNSLNERSKEDIEETTLDYAQIKALAIGDPRIKERASVQNELSKYIMLQKRINDNYINQERQLLDLPHKIKNAADYRDDLLKDVSIYWANKKEYTTDERNLLKEKISDALKDNILKKEETYLLDYQGFEVYLPPRMISSNEFLIIKGSRKYTLNINKEGGILAKLNNFFEAMNDRYEKAKEEVETLENKRIDIENSLRHKVNYSETIKNLETKLKQLDKELHINVK